VVPRTRRKLIAAVAGVLLASVPVVLVHRALDSYVERQVRADVGASARRAILRAENRIDQTIEGLRRIATGAADCDKVDLAALSRAVVTTTPIKEIALLGADGSPQCQHRGLPAHPWLLSREVAIAGSGVLLAVVRPLDMRERTLRVHWRPSEQGLGVAAFIPADMFMPGDPVEASADRPEVRVMLSEGTVIAGSDIETPWPAALADTVLVQAESQRYPLVAVASARRSALAAVHSELSTIGAVGSGAIALLMFALAVILPWRDRNNPIIEMERALARNEFVPYYQPLVDLQTGKVIGAEVLVRWRKPNGDVVPPARFIPLAESSGLIIDITRALLRAVRDELGPALAQRPKAKIGFNLAGQHFADETIVADVRAVFARSQVAYSQLVFEVTERERLDDLTTARRVIAALQGLGCRVAIDDVGIRHGGLSYMLKLGVDFIKIDKMFVDAISTERHTATMIDTLVDLARNMRMGIIAEGVETFEQVTYLREHGIRMAQGYVFAPPLPGALFLQLLESIDPLRPGSVAEAGPASALAQYAAERRAAAA
jgi:sensor c-di-GMP phosphodiesterase-like protein